MWIDTLSSPIVLAAKSDCSVLERPTSGIFLLWRSPAIGGVPAYRLRFQVPLNLKTIQRWYHLMRLCIYHSVTQELPKLAGPIEIDETMFGGRRPGKRGGGAEGKILVFGMYKRNGLVVTFPISSRIKQELLPLISAHTKPGSLYYTDDWQAYADLDRVEEALAASASADQLLSLSKDAYFGVAIQRRRAQILTVLGRHAEALDILADLLARPGPFVIDELLHQREWVPLRSHHRYGALVQQYGGNL